MSGVFGQNNTNDQKEWVVRTQLLDELQQCYKSMSDQLDNYQQFHQGDGSNKTKFGKDVLAQVDRLLANPAWVNSAFLRTTVKPLMDIRERFVKMLHRTPEAMNESLATYQQGFGVASDSLRMCLYILLYQADGHSLATWEHQLLALASHAQSRPIYTTEEAVLRVLRNRPMQSSLAYVTVDIAEQHVLMTPEKCDHLGQALVTLQAKGMPDCRILSFTHLGHRYQLVNKGRCIELTKM